MPIACVESALLTNVHFLSTKKCIAAKGTLHNMSEMFPKKWHNFFGVLSLRCNYKSDN